MLATLVDAAEPAMYYDSRTHPVYGSRISTMLSELGSVLYVPIRNEFGAQRGFLYLDQVRQSTFLSEGFLGRIEEYVTGTLQPALHTSRESVGWEDIKRMTWEV